MAERIVSPGVFTRENDLSYLPQGVSEIGAAFIGPTPKGPAFIPTLVESQNDYTRQFGAADGKSYVPYTVRNYLKNAGRATIVRVCGLGGYKSDTVSVSLTANNVTSSLSTSTTISTILAPTDSSATASGWNITGSSTESVDFIISNGIVGYSCSLNPDSTNYVLDVFGASPQGSKELYVYHNNATIGASVQTIVASGSVIVTGSVQSADPEAIMLSGSNQHSVASTPDIQSQEVSGTTYNLFKFYTFNAGASDVKISFNNIKAASEIPGSDYGTFGVTVRKITDTDAKQDVVETFSNCNLDPTSPNYIARVIGDQYQVYSADADGNSKLVLYGDFAPKSKYVRVEMNADVVTGAAPAASVPMGFGTYKTPISGSGLVFQAITYNTTQYDGTDWDYKTHLGFDFTDTGNLHIQKPLSNNSTAIAGTFSLANCQMTATDNITQTAFILASAPLKNRKFSVALQGGFDGFDPTVVKNMGTDIVATNVMGLDCSTTGADGTLAYKKAIDTVSNPDEFDINMLVMPGILRDVHASIINYANDMVEERADVFLLFDDTILTATVAVAIDAIADMNSNYAATYYPWVKTYDSDNTRYMWVPPSVVMAGVIAFNDRVAAEWYAPAGLNRGGIDGALQVYTRLTHAERDELYENRVNPIAAFAGQGIAAWGQKTTQIKTSALDRINVRRLMIAMKKYIASTTKYLVFEQNTIATRNRFTSIVNPYLEGIQQKQGLYTFKVVMDETNNTADVIDRNQMKGDIYLQPTKTAEMIIIDFNITPTGAVFGE